MEDIMGKLFVIMGKSATGKDTVYHEVIKRCPDLERVIPYTTRPIRAGETNGSEYFFCDIDELHKMKKDGKVIECREYDTVHGVWFYFTVNDGQISLDNKDYIMISTLEGYKKVSKHFGEEKTIPIYIEVDDFTRMERSLKREKKQDTPCVAEVCRRFLADEADFSKEKLKSVKIYKPIINHDLEECIEEVIKLIAHS